VAEAGLGGEPVLVLGLVLARSLVVAVGGPTQGLVSCLYILVEVVGDSPVGVGMLHQLGLGLVPVYLAEGVYLRVP